MLIHSSLSKPQNPSVISLRCVLARENVMKSTYADVKQQARWGRRCRGEVSSWTDPSTQKLKIVQSEVFI